jgi:hypothetical protein
MRAYPQIILCAAMLLALLSVSQAQATTSTTAAAPGTTTAPIVATTTKSSGAPLPLAPVPFVAPVFLALAGLSAGYAVTSY